MRTSSRATVAFVALSFLAFPSAFAASSTRVAGTWDLYGEAKPAGAAKPDAYHGTVGVQEGAGGKLDLTFDYTYDLTGSHVTLTGTGTRVGTKITYELPLATGMTDKVGALANGGDVADAGKITGTMWLTTSGRLLWTHWTSSKDGSTGEERLRRTASADPATTPTAPVTPVTPTKPTPPDEPAPTKDLITLVDGDGKDVPADKKNTDGVIVPLDIDEAGAHHLLPVKLTPPPGTAAGATFQLAPTGNVALWTDADKTKRAESTIPAAAITLYVEGLHASAGETIGVQLLAGSKAVAQDKAKVVVARSAFLILGHGNAGSFRLDDYLSSHRIDGRTNPTIAEGKDESGKPTPWAVYTLTSQKGASLALSTEGSAVAYDGHSNFGLGYAFSPGYSSLSQFMLIADAQVPVNWEYLREHQGHPDLMFSNAEYGDDASTSEFSDPVQVPKEIEGTHGTYATSRYPASGGDGNRCHLIKGSPSWHDHHYGDPDNTRIVIKAGARDMPAKKWGKLFLNSCYSGPYYFDSFGGHGTLFFTTDESSSADTSALFLEGCIEGKSNDDTLKSLNAAENINDYKVFSR